jgi:phospholipid-translocating ATPase
VSGPSAYLQKSGDTLQRKQPSAQTADAPWDLWLSSSAFSDKFKARYPPNIVRNQKYNLASFFPIVLYEQFKFFFNLYFLLVALSQFVPQLRIGAYLGYGARALGPN